MLFHLAWHYTTYGCLQDAMFPSDILSPNQNEAFYLTILAAKNDWKLNSGGLSQALRGTQIQTQNVTAVYSTPR
jgi:hypothetical protein